MKSKMKKKLIAFMLCMVLVICNSVSILADTPAPETKTTQQVKETKTVKEEKASEESKTAAKESGTSEQSEEEEAPEVKTTEKKEETTKATTESTKATTETAEETTTEAKEDNTKATTEATTTEGKEETSDSSEEDKKENKEATTTEGKEETAPTELTYTNDDVIITVSEVAEGAIPEGAELKVVSILKNDTETKEQYAEVEKQIQEKAAETETEIKGFLAYDITFVDEDGNEIEPNSEVKVSMEYKQAAIPEEITAEDAKDAEVSVMHLEEDTDGKVSQVVDMGEAGKVDTLKTTDENKVEKVEVKTESFSVYTITWYFGYSWNPSDEKSIRFHYVDNNGNSLDGKTGSDSISTEWEGDKLSLASYQQNITGYVYDHTTVQKYDNTVEVKSLSYEKYKNKYSLKYVTTDNEEEVFTPTWGVDDNGKVTQYYDVFLVYVPSTGGSGNKLGAPDHNKYIKQNTLGEDYTLTLDVTGKRGEKSGIDVLLVIDKSGSMGSGKGSLMSEVKTAVTGENGIISKVLPDNQSINSISAISFSSNQYQWEDISTNWEGFSNKYQVSEAVDDLSSNGATNWELAMMKAENKLAQRVSDNQKVVIFLSDGIPGYYYNDNGNESGDGNPSSGSQASITARNQAVNYVKSTNYLKNSAIYSVYLNNNTKNSMTAFAEDLEKDGINASAVDGTDVGTSLGNLINSIITPEYKNVTIEDTLSEYVELIDGKDTKFEVTKKSQDGNNQKLDNTEYYIDINEDEEGHTKITLNLLSGNALKDNVTYSLSFRVKPSQKAIDTFIEEGGYLHEGDLGTDAPEVNEEDWTSSEKEGFYSNESAKVTYTENDGTQQNAEYDRPVVQIDPKTINIPETPNPTDGSITKTMGDVVDDKYPINLEVKTRLEETSEKANVDVILVIDESSSMKDDDRMDHTKAAAKAFVKGFVGEENTVSSIHKVGIVTFDSIASIEEFSSTGSEYEKCFSGDVNVLNQKINSLSPVNQKNNNKRGGTNTQDGLKKALDLAGKTSNRTYVILLTDGVPTFHNVGESGWDGGSTYSKPDDFNAAAQAAKDLSAQVEKIFTVGLLNGYGNNSVELQVARTLLASNNDSHTVVGYEHTYKMESSSYNNNAMSKVVWDRNTTYDYSDGYFEVKSGEDASNKLQDIWEELATIINNETAGSTGDGWIVTDKIANYTNFLSLEKAEINGYQLELSNDGKELTTDINGQNVIVAVYDDSNTTITWYLNANLATKSIKYNHGTDYTYNLTYYVDFSDSDKTEFLPTNESTYVTPKENEDNKIYPAKMPFFVNVVGTKVDAVDTDAELSGAQFAVYSTQEDANNGQNPIDISTGDDDGHFAFQFGQTDFTKEENQENYSLTIYLKELTAPEGYVKDESIHQITITVNSVTYDNHGYPSGNVTVSYNGTDNSLLSVNNETMQLLFKNESRPDWGIVKRNGNNTSQFLEDAVFELYVETGETVANTVFYTGTSNDNGVINEWKRSSDDVTIQSKDMPTGTYILKEKTAPEGYKRSEVEWQIVITATDVRISIFQSNNESTPIKVTGADLVRLGLEEQDEYYYYDNTMSYELPESGGPGIYWYTLSGALLMMGAALIVYKQQRKREVLLKK